MASTTRRDQQSTESQTEGQNARQHSHRAGQRRGRIVSQTPGRVRIRLHPEHRQQAVLGPIEQELRGCEGVSNVATNARTGSVLIQYDRHHLSFDDVLALCHDLGMVAKDVTDAELIPDDADQSAASVQPEVGHSSTAVTVMDALTDLDRRVSDLTGGKLDVKLLFPLSLGALAVRQIATSGLGLAEVPGYVLLWYAFDSFYKLHQRRTAHLVETAVEHMQAHPDPAADDIMLIDETGD